jgi:hypothetical protein
MKKTLLAALMAATTLSVAASDAFARNYRNEDSLSSNDIQANASTNDTRGNAAVKSTGMGIKYGTANRPDVKNERYARDAQGRYVDAYGRLVDANGRVIDDSYYAPASGYVVYRPYYGTVYRPYYSSTYGSRKDSPYNEYYYVTTREPGIYQHPPMGNAEGLETGDDTRR